MRNIFRPLIVIGLIASLLQGCGTAGMNIASSTGNPDAKTANLQSRPTKDTKIREKATDDLPSIAKEQQILAKLGYLPFDIVKGKLVWKYDLPWSLTSLWSYGTNNVILRGGVMAFQHASGISVDGIVGQQTWSKLQYADKNNIQNRGGYAYVLVSERQPETLTLYYNGRVVLHTLANTGVYGAETSIGTFPVYARYYSQTMKGTNLDGSHYSDPGVPYVSYFNGGDAVHGFVRSSYGYPQSLGCVELPYSQASIAWEYMNYGTLVTVGR